ncbi:hypothetical protein HY061_01685 [Candidatus Azambacteria bacterium]|nr:hypothetical protein [Candidatus Azambacteria bacterium]
MISFDEFKKVEIKIGTILMAEKIPEADRLIKLSIDVGEETPRVIISGIAEYYLEPAILIGKQVPVLVNLTPRTILGHESQGMVLYAVGDGFLTTLSPENKIPSGTKIQ